MHFIDLLPVSDQAAFYSAMRQRQFTETLNERLGDHRYQVDMTTQRLGFRSDASDAQIDLHIDLVASAAPGPGSIMWGWAHPQGQGGPVDRLKAYGEEHGIPTLTTPEVPLPRDTSSGEVPDDMASLAHQLGVTAVAVTSVPLYYSIPAEGGTRVVFLASGLDLPDLRIDERTPTTIAQTLQSGMTHDHRGALHGLAVRAGWQISWTDEWTSGTLTDPVNGSSLTATFDPMARLTDLSASLQSR